MLNSEWLKREKTISNVLFGIVFVMHTSVVLLGAFLAYKISPDIKALVPLIISGLTIHGLILLIKSHRATIESIDKTIALLRVVENKDAKIS